VTLTAPPRLALVHAHPDDESLWTGGTIAHYASLGVHVTVVTCTLGEEGEIIPASLNELRAEAADQLGGYRVGELRSACAALRVNDHRFLGGIGRWRDSGMVGVEANRHPRAFVGGDPALQTEQLAEVLREVKPQVVVSYDSFGGYGHPDHIRAHEITTAAAAQVPDVLRVFHSVTSRDAVAAGLKKLQGVDGVPYRMPEPGELPVVDDEVITTRVAIDAHVPTKLSALRAHATQVSVWQNGEGAACYALSNGITQPVVGTEFYVLAAGPSEGAETDLFGGLNDVERMR
jgi:N-acetyl-1-D-myo-inositol-2-amino-2-deoxy-alpha-D-glucopyranoside deacetylase